jgi:hypothetical protein
VLRAPRRARPRDWPLRIGLFVLVVAWPVALWLGANASLAKAPPRARAAYVVHGGDCARSDLSEGKYYPGGGALDVPFQMYASRVSEQLGCLAQLAALGDISDSLGVYNMTTGAWGPNTLGGLTYNNALALQDIRGRVGSCNDAGTCALGDLPGNLSSRMRQLVRAAGSWNVTTSTYDDHSGLWLLDRLDQHGIATLDRLSAIGDKLDTLHADLQAAASSTTPGDGGGGVAETVSLSTVDREHSDTNDSEIASVLWVIVGVLVATPFFNHLLRELLAL